MRQGQTRVSLVFLFNNGISAFTNTDKLLLWNTTLVLSDLTTLADIVAAECVFDGYTEVTLNGLYVTGFSAGGEAQAIYNKASTFKQTGVVNTDTAAGWAIIDSSGTNLRAVGQFDSPFAFNKDTNELIMVHKFWQNFDSDADVMTSVGP